MKKLDWSKARPNPYVKGKKKSVSIRLDPEIINWLKEESERQGLRGYQTLANAVLADAMKKSQFYNVEERLERIEEALFKERA